MKAQGKYTIEAFEEYHQRNPHIYTMFCHYALQMAQQRKYYSAKAVFHRVRWETAIRGDEEEEFKISDGWISHYARKFMNDYPQYDGFFRTMKRQYSYFEE